VNATTLTITPLIVPASLEDRDAADFLTFGALNRLVCDEATGLPDLAPDAAQMLAAWQENTDSLSLGFVARADDDVVGMLAMDFAQEADARAAEIDVLVPESSAGLGVEDAVLDLAEREAHARGRTLLQKWTLHRPIATERMIVPRTGWGRIPAIPLTDALERHGYVCEQVERNSELDLRADPAPLVAALAEAEAHAGPDYRTVHWMAPTPVEHRDGYAAILARLSTDAPSGDMEFVAEEWDAERVIRRDARNTAAGQAFSVVAVQHVPTGALVAYNELLIGADRGGVTHQFGTLVASEHRGHRLGMIVKCANLLQWRELMPASPVVSTFNAEENRPMLSINEAIGFVPVSYAGAWQKRI
jgi:GNAT superfamily N-acetyltransferase